MLLTNLQKSTFTSTFFLSTFLSLDLSDHMTNTWQSCDLYFSHQNHLSPSLHAINIMGWWLIFLITSTGLCSTGNLKSCDCVLYFSMVRIIFVRLSTLIYLCIFWYVCWNVFFTLLEIFCERNCSQPHAEFSCYC